MTNLESPVATFMFQDTVIIVTGDGSMYQWYRDHTGEWVWRKLTFQLQRM